MDFLVKSLTYIVICNTTVKYDYTSK